MASHYADGTRLPPAENTQAPPPAVLGQMADALIWPLLVLQRDATLLHANLAARRLLQQTGPLRLDPARRVGPALAADKPAFDAALAAACDGKRSVLRWPQAGAGCSASLAPLPPSGNNLPLLLLAVSASEGRAATIAAYAETHRLSPSETRVLQRLALGDDGPAAAAWLGVQPATVRSQIASARRKTGHGSVRELVLALAVLPPLGV